MELMRLINYGTDKVDYFSYVYRLCQRYTNGDNVWPNRDTKFEYLEIY